MTNGVTLLLPGMTLNRTAFPPVEGPVISPDFNRFYASPKADGRHLMMAYTDRLDAILTASEDWNRRPRVVVGHSFGGMLALYWLLCTPAPPTIDGLILISTTAGPMYHSVRLRVQLPFGRAVRIPFAPLLPLWNHSSVTKVLKRLATGSLAVHDVDFQTVTNPTDTRVDRAGWRNTDWRAMRTYRLAMRGFDVRHKLGEVQVPTAIIHGGKDSLFQLSEAEVLSRGIVGSRLISVPGAGHALPLTHGDVVAKALNQIRVRSSERS